MFLARQGHDVEVWTGFPHYPAWRPAKGRAPAVRETLDGVVVHRRWHFVPRSQTAGRRALYEAALTLGALTSMAHLRKPDVVLGVTPTLSGAVAAAVAARRFRSPFALLVHDVMGKAAAQSGVAGGQRVAATVGAVERAVARRADGIAIIAEGFRRYFVAAGVPDQRIVRLRTWTVGPPSGEPPTTTRERLGWRPDEFVVLHAGNMGHKQGLGNLIQAATLLRDVDGVRIVLAGDGNDRPNLERRNRAEGLDNLEFIGPQNWPDYRAMLEAADVLVVNQRATVLDMALPSKLTSYFASGRPTIAAVAEVSETAQEIRLSGGGVVVPADDPKALASAALALRDAPERCKELGESANRFASAVLRSETALPEYEAFLVGVRELTSSA
jgi:glycosyltransferase involved in cell wall biosynthesis